MVKLVCDESLPCVAIVERFLRQTLAQAVGSPGTIALLNSPQNPHYIPAAKRDITDAALLDLLLFKTHGPKNLTDCQERSHKPIYENKKSAQSLNGHIMYSLICPNYGRYSAYTDECIGFL